MTDADLAPLLAPHTRSVRDVVVALRALAREVMPDAGEQVDLPDHALAFGFGPPGGVRMRGLAVGVIPHIAHVNVQLADGALLDDPSGIVEGTGKRIRHVTCRSLDDVERPALRALLEEQAERRRPGREGSG
jgi:Asp-tRNA(Asn)/Glu-tRNA(Gln) amidotransferase A subunit family amidase